MRLGRRYGDARLEAAAARALAVRALSYRSVESILRNGLDGLPTPGSEPVTTTIGDHANVRGAGYTSEEGSLHAHHTTIDKLHALALTGMARALTDQPERPDYADLGFEERLGLLVDREIQDRENRRLARHLKAARLRSDAVIEDLDLRGPRGLDRSTVLGLAEGHWVTAHRNVLVTGPTGVGKTFLACALAHAAIRRGHTALYLRVPRLLDEPALARADGRLPRLMAAWAKVDVLVRRPRPLCRCLPHGRPTCWR